MNKLLISVILFPIFIELLGQNNTDYNKKVLERVSKLSYDVKVARDSNIIALKNSKIYKKLVVEKEVSQKYLTALTGIGMLLSSSDGEVFSIPLSVENILEKDTQQYEFVSQNLRIGASGGLTPEIVRLFYRYRSKYKYFGDESDVFYDANGNTERVDNPFNLSIAFAFIEPENKEVLEALYESVISNNHFWSSIDKVDVKKYKYPYILFSQSFQKHINKVAPDSRYNLYKYKGLGESITAGFFEVTANKFFVLDHVDTGNEYTSITSAIGDTFILLNATYKNIDTEGRTIFSAGSLIIYYNGKEYKFDKTESIMADGFGVVLEALNPLSKKTFWLVFPLSKEITGNVFWMPAGSKQRIYLGDI